MKIILAGYGFYALGDQNLKGGTIFPAFSRWVKINKNNNIQLTCLTRSEESIINAEKRISTFLNNHDLSSKITFKCIKYNELESDELYSCAIVAIPEKYHLETIKYISNFTKEILCVKPCTESNYQVEELITFAEGISANIFVDFHKRFDESNIEFINNASKLKFKNGVFNFSYGQKEIVPKQYFSKWAHFSNPFQYLAPHYLDIIFKIITLQNYNHKILKISGAVNKLNFEDRPEIISFVSCNLKLDYGKSYFIVNSSTNWMEPKATPFNSRQRIEFQTSGLHLISEQDNRGQLVIDNNAVKIPNPHFMTNDEFLVSSGYGIFSYCNFLEYISNRFPKDALLSIKNYIPISKVIDYVNSKLVN